MGRRAPTETIVAIIHAFLRERTWKQAELADSIGINVKALKKRLDELCLHGFPLTEEKEHPHVYWSVPKDWFPGGTLLTREEADTLLRLLGRLPKSKARERAISALLRAASRGSPMPSTAVVSPSVPDSEANHLSLAEDAAREKVSLHVYFFSADRGALEWRHVSVQKIIPGPPAKLCAVCHRDDRLKWFRVDNVIEAELDRATAFRGATEDAVDSYVKGSLHGFVDEARPVEVTFVAREPAWRWIRRSLPDTTIEVPVSGGVRFTVTTRGVLMLARMLVGLGDLVRIETTTVRNLVRELARGALRSAEEMDPFQQLELLPS